QDSPTYHPGGRPVALSPDGRIVACVFDGHGVRLYEVNSGKELPALESFAQAADRPSGSVVTMDFAPDGKTLATLDFEGTIRIWDWERAKELRSFHATGPADRFKGHARLAHTPD